MYCSQCGKELPDGAKFCPDCGQGVNAPVGKTISLESVKECAVKAGGIIQKIFHHTKEKALTAYTVCREKAVSMDKKKLLLIAILSVVAIVAVVLLLTLPAALSQRIEGTYAHLTSNRTFVLEQTDKTSGTFEIYDGDKKVGKEHLRYEKTWTREGDVLTLVFDEDTTFYFMIIDGALIDLDKPTDQPSLYNLIAPKGVLFDYEITAGATKYEFSSNGKLLWYNSYLYGDGTYYIDGNAIYCQKNEAAAMRREYGTVYLPDDYTGDDPQITFWMYDDDHITRASDVYVKK